MIALCLAATVGCSSLEGKPVASYDLIIDEPQRLRFAGKGAGAGMMLSSSMGPMGVAIGVAIDEGIAKEIHTAFNDAGHSLESLVTSAADEASNTFATDEHRIHIHRLGVKMSQNETVIADIEGEILTSKGVSIATLKTPDESDRVPLEQVKRDGNATYQLLKNALVQAMIKHH